MMQYHATQRAVNWLARLCAALAACALSFAGAAWAQSGEPIKIGYGISQTGGLAPNGKSALLAQKIWEEDINAKGGLLGRPVKLVYYDDQTNPATVPGIYTKLLDIDKVDLIIGGYGTNLLAPAMPVAMQRKKVLIGLLGNAVNSAFNYPNYFSMIPTGPDPNLSVTKDFFDVAVRQNPKPKTVAIVAADAEFGLQTSKGARENAKATGLTVVYDRRYPSATTDLVPVVRAMAETNPDLVIVTRSAWCAGGQRDRLQAENDRWCHGRPAEHGDQGSARSAAQRLDQLRLLAAGPKAADRRRGRADEEVPSARVSRRRGCARLLHGAVELCPAPGAPAGNRSDREPR